MKNNHRIRVFLTVGAIVFLGSGPVALLGGIASIYFWKDLLLNGVETEASIVGQVESANKRRNPGFAPVFRYQTAEGQTVERPGAMFRIAPVWKIGDQVRIFYDPIKPERMTVLSRTQITTWISLVTIAGIAMTAIGCALLVYKSRLRRNDNRESSNRL